MLLVADVADSGGLINAIVRQSKALTGTLGTHTLTTVTTVMLKGDNKSLKVIKRKQKERR